MLKINLRPAAMDEVEEAWLWYEQQRPGLGDEFRACVEVAMTAAARRPLSYPKVEGRVRRVLVRRFPYSILYITETDRIEILAVFHGSREPGAWRGR